MRVARPKTRLYVLYVCVTVATMPEGTFRALGSVGIVDPFLVRAPEDPSGYNDTADAVTPQETHDFAADPGIESNVEVVVVPSLELGCWLTGLTYDTDSNLRRGAIVGAVESYGSDRFSARRPLSQLLAPGSGH